MHAIVRVHICVSAAKIKSLKKFSNVYIPHLVTHRVGFPTRFFGLDLLKTKSGGHRLATN